MQPVFSLHAHNVLQNVIVDTISDAKVTKFHKRGMEVVGVAVLEATEVHGTGGYPVAAGLPAQSSLDKPTDNPRMSRTSLAVPDVAADSDVPATATASPSGMKGVWNRLFKRDKSKSRTDIPSAASSPDVTPRGSRGNSPQPPERASESTPVLLPAVLGIQPTLSAIVLPPPSQRPTAYVWIVNRWLKGTPQSLFGNVLSGVMGTSSSPHADTGARVELRFEWRRRAKGVRPGRTTMDGGEPRAPFMAAASTLSLASAADLPDSPDPANTRGSAETDPGASRTHARTQSTTSMPARDADDGAESDAEDSATLWTCCLIGRRIPAGAPAGGPVRVDTGAQDGTLRVKVATLAPTPHHPKVVAALKVPAPLPDVEVDALRARRRALASICVGQAASGDVEGLVLSGEEIKSIAASMAMWIICRENIGGVGLVTRKGDGWRIRA